MYYRGKVLKIRICKEGWCDFSWMKPFRGSNMEGLCWLDGDVEKKPIGRGDIQESRIWDFYREWLYRRKNGSIFLREKSSKIMNFACLDLSEELFEV